jgi:lysozyme
MQTSDRGLDFIRHHEGLETQAYPDPGSSDGHPWTIGVGHTKGVKKGDTCTVEEAMEWLRDDVVGAETAVLRLVNVPLSQAEFDALVSFVFNVGAGAFEKSTLLRMLNDEDREGAAAQFKRWNKNDGRVMAGLTTRREAEAKMFETGLA